MATKKQSNETNGVKNEKNVSQITLTRPFSPPTISLKPKIF